MNKSKDFTDYNGAKRKSILRGVKEKPTRSGPHLRDKKVGIKVKSDRYKALLAELKRYWEYRRRYQRRPKHSNWCPHWEKDIKSTVKKLKEMKESYKKEGIWERVKDFGALV